MMVNDKKCYEIVTGKMKNYIEQRYDTKSPNEEGYSPIESFTPYHVPKPESKSMLHKDPQIYNKTIKESDFYSNLINKNLYSLQTIVPQSQVFNHFVPHGDFLFPQTNRINNHFVYHNPLPYNQIGYHDYLQSNIEYVNDSKYKEKLKPYEICKYCEEIYLFFLEKSEKVRIFRCFYCGNLINQSSFEAFVKNYHYNKPTIREKELIKGNDSYQITNSNSITLSKQINPSSNPAESYITNENVQTKESINILQKSSDIKCSLDDLSKAILHNDSINKKINVLSEANGLDQSKEHKEILAKDDKKVVISFENEDASTKGLSLAEAFMEKKMNFLEKMKKRSSEKEVNKTTINQDKNTHFESIIESNNEAISGRNKNLSLLNRSLPKSKQKEQVNNLKYLSCKKEPSQELLDRLIKGRKISVNYTINLDE
jgi:hypothetical protein